MTDRNMLCANWYCIASVMSIGHIEQQALVFYKDNFHQGTSCHRQVRSFSALSDASARMPYKLPEVVRRMHCSNVI